MADTKISALTSGNPAQSGDEIPIARSGANYKITAGSIASLATASPAGSDTFVQFNDGGAFGAEAGFAYNKTTNTLSVEKIALGTAGSATGVLTLAGSTSGVVTLQPAAAAGTYTLTLPTSDGNSGEVLTTDGAGVLSWSAVSATPGGSSGQLQYNNAGALGGTSGITTTGTELTIASGTKTASAPTLDISQTWNNSGVTFTGWKLNVTDTASAAGSLLADLQVGGTSYFSVQKTGRLRLVGQTFQEIETSNVIRFLFGGSVTPRAGVGSGNFVVNDAGSYRWHSGDNIGSGSSDLFLYRDAAGTLAQRNATNAQTLRVYNTYTDANNYERAKIAWDTNVLKIGTEKGSGGGTARALELQTDATTRLTIGASGGVTIADANDVAVGTTTGTKIGTATSQKLGFWNATPIVQPTTAVAAATVAATGIGDVVAASTTFDGYTIPQIVKALRNAGLLA